MSSWWRRAFYSRGSYQGRRSRLQALCVPHLPLVHSKVVRDFMPERLLYQTDSLWQLDPKPGNETARRLSLTPGIWFSDESRTRTSAEKGSHRRTDYARVAGSRGW